MAGVSLDKSGLSAVLNHTQEGYFFVYLFAKNDRSNITRREQSALKELANVLVGFNQDEIDHLIATGELIKLEKNDE